MNNVYPMLPKLTVNRQFMHDFITENTPCCAFGAIEDRNRKSGLIALRLNDVIPNEVTDKGFCLGHSLYGSSRFEVVHFVFQFYGFKTYNVLINPNDPLIREVLKMMIEDGGYFIFVINPDNSVTAFRSSFGQDTLCELQHNIIRISNSNTSDSDYQKAFSTFNKNPDPSGEILNWVCRNNIEYLELKKDCLELKPSF